MEQLISEVEGYCASAGIKPQKLLRDAYGAGWGVWRAWKSGQSSPTMHVVDRLRAYMADTPPETYRDRKRSAAA